MVSYSEYPYSASNPEMYSLSPTSVGANVFPNITHELIEIPLKASTSPPYHASIEVLDSVMDWLCETLECK